MHNVHNLISRAWMKKLINSFFFIISISISLNVHSETEKDDKPGGWFFYKEKKDIEKPKKLEKPKPKLQIQSVSPAFQGLPDINYDDPNPVKTLKALQKQLEISQAKAVLYPTKANVNGWAKINHAVVKRTARFADIATRQKWQNPQYDFNMQKPISQGGIEVWGEERKKSTRKEIAKIAKTHGLFFFFRGDCPYCHKFAPRLREFTEKYGFEVIPVTLDGGGLSDYPNPEFKPKMIKELKVEYVPAVFLANPKSKIISPVTFGLISTSELEDRIYKLFYMKEDQQIYQVAN